MSRSRAVKTSVGWTAAAVVVVASACVIENSTPPYVPPAPRPITRVVALEAGAPVDGAIDAAPNSPMPPAPAAGDGGEAAPP